MAESATGSQRLRGNWQGWPLISQVAVGFNFYTREQFYLISKFARIREKKKKKKSQLVLSINPCSVIIVLNVL